jgi:hypothetical protein
MIMVMCMGIKVQNNARLSRAYCICWILIVAIAQKTTVVLTVTVANDVLISETTSPAARESTISPLMVLSVDELLKDGVAVTPLTWIPKDLLLVVDIILKRIWYTPVLVMVTLGRLYVMPLVVEEAKGMVPKNGIDSGTPLYVE